VSTRSGHGKCSQGCKVEFSKSGDIPNFLDG
jgi:hypothetical protein